jgi:acyl-CoA synthetase (AMP-forming)/AMP-acid ligase II
MNTLGDILTEQTQRHPDRVAQRLARFKRPKEIIILPEIPKTGTGKIDKPTLLRHYGEGFS